MHIGSVGYALDRKPEPYQTVKDGRKRVPVFDGLWNFSGLAVIDPILVRADNFISGLIGAIEEVPFAVPRSFVDTHRERIRKGEPIRPTLAQDPNHLSEGPKASR